METTRSGTDAIELETRIEASPETVWGFFTDPQLMKRWKGHTAELDPQPGGIYRVQIGPGIVARGEYVELEPPRRLVFTWGWEGEDSVVQPGASTVEVTLEAAGDGTRLVLRHLGLPSEDQRAEHTKGWSRYLGRLEVAAPGGNPGPDQLGAS